MTTTKSKSGKNRTIGQASILHFPAGARLRHIDDSAILATVRAGAGCSVNIAERCATFKEKAGWITDFDHFSHLCVSDMRQAFDESRREGKRITHNRQRTWKFLFDYFAARIGIDRKLEITALDREGNYACTLVDEDEDQDAWNEFLQLGRRFGIAPAQLESLRRIAQNRKRREEQRAKGVE